MRSRSAARSDPTAPDRPPARARPRAAPAPRAPTSRSATPTGMVHGSPPSCTARDEVGRVDLGRQHADHHRSSRRLRVGDRRGQARDRGIEPARGPGHLHLLGALGHQRPPWSEIGDVARSATRRGRSSSRSAVRNSQRCRASDCIAPGIAPDRSAVTTVCTPTSGPSANTRWRSSHTPCRLSSHSARKAAEAVEHDHDPRAGRTRRAIRAGPTAVQLDPQPAGPAAPGARARAGAPPNRRGGARPTGRARRRPCRARARGGRRDARRPARASTIDPQRGRGAGAPDAERAAGCRRPAPTPPGTGSARRDRRPARPAPPCPVRRRPRPDRVRRLSARRARPRPAAGPATAAEATAVPTGGAPPSPRRRAAGGR